MVSPVKRLHQAKVRNQFKKEDNDPDSDLIVDACDEIHEWICWYQSQPNCIGVKNKGRGRACTCNKDLPIGDDVTTNATGMEMYMLSFAMANREEQTKTVCEWIKYASMRVGENRFMFNKEQQTCRFIMPGPIHPFHAAKIR